MLDKQKDIDARHRRDARSHARADCARRDGSRQARLRAEAADLVGRRSAPAVAAQGEEHASVATQMGNQGHSWDDARTAVEYVWAGAIGDVREVHIWTNRPLGYWPQGIPRPEAADAAAPSGFRWNGPGVECASRQRDAPATIRCPRRCAWDLFLGVGAARRLSPGVSPVQLARLGRLGHAARSATWART